MSDQEATTLRSRATSSTVWHPGPPDHPPATFTAEELEWLENRADVDDYLQRTATDLLAAIERWTVPSTFRLYVETLDELLGDGEAFDPVIDKLAYRGLKTLVVGLSKAGKSFTLWAKSAEAIRNGRCVLYLSEEPRGTVADKVRSFGLVGQYGEAFYVSRRQHDEVRNVKWSEIVERLALDVQSKGIDLVVIDTLRPWINLDGEESNNADKVGKAIDALSAVCEAGAAVVVIHQSPWDSDRARGSTEYHASSDIILVVKGEGSGPRTIKHMGGRVEGIPDIQTFRWTGSSMEDLGKMRHDKAERLVEVLQVVEVATEPLTAEQVAEQTDYSLRSVQRWLEDLADRYKVRRIEGAVVPGHGQEPDRWERPPEFLAALVDLE